MTVSLTVWRSVPAKVKKAFEELDHQRDWSEQDKANVASQLKCFLAVRKLFAR
jgi:hypothetical protein